MRLYFWSVRQFMKDVVQMLEIAHYRLLICAGVLVFCCLIFSIRGGDSYRVSLFHLINIFISKFRLDHLLASKLALFWFCVQ